MVVGCWFSNLEVLEIETTMVFRIMMIVVIFILAATLCDSVEQNLAPPPVFWQWNAKYAGTRGRSSEATPPEEIYPEYVQSYFDRSNLEKSSTIMGSYNRENPERWFGHQSLRSREDGSSILVLGKRLKLSHGPRKRRSQLEISSYKDDLQSLQNFRRKNSKPSVSSDADVSEIVYLDPLFKIPVVQRVATILNRPKMRPTTTTPSPTLTTKTGVKSQRRCDALNGDCLDEFQKVFSVGPFVQTRLAA